MLASVLIATVNKYVSYKLDTILLEVVTLLIYGLNINCFTETAVF